MNWDGFGVRVGNQTGWVYLTFCKEAAEEITKVSETRSLGETKLGHVIAIRMNTVGYKVCKILQSLTEHPPQSLISSVRVIGKGGG